ncbi:brain and acute leukemia cytoplasmic protein isoform 1-6-8 [Camelus ferus]|nr:brain and acute leukemia cytoplasmic protein isoform 1-6-8 [Camelus ferus]
MNHRPLVCFSRALLVSLQYKKGPQLAKLLLKRWEFNFSSISASSLVWNWGDWERQEEKEGVLEDGLSSSGVSRSAAPGGMPNAEKKMSCGTQCPNPQSLSSGPLTQKQNGLRTTEKYLLKYSAQGEAWMGLQLWETELSLWRASGSDDKDTRQAGGREPRLQLSEGLAVRLDAVEAKRDTKRTSAKEVTINVPDSIRQVDRSRRITKNCVN